MIGRQEDNDVNPGGRQLPQRFILKILGHCETTGLWGIKHTRTPVDKMVTFAKNHQLCLPIVQLIVTKEGLFVLPLDYRKGAAPDGKEGVSVVDIDVAVPDTRATCVPGKDGDDSKRKKSHRFRIKAHFRIVKRRSRVKKKVEELLSGKDKRDLCPGCGRDKADHDESVRSLTDVRLLEKYKAIDWKSRGAAFYPIDNISYGVQDLVYTRVFSMIEVADVGAPYKKATSPFTCHSFVCESHNTAKMLTYSLDAAFQAYGKTLKEQRDRL